ncbi:MAG: hydantoinase/oxoprolinase family protein [Thermomicrobiales bacterium]|nr:hydantoinase/oxoprolinase family protein [Thermomicrobiales bacterium]
MTGRYRLGIDTGGTFTDATLIDEATGELAIAKVPSTPADPAIGFLNAATRILRQQRVSPDQVEYVVHGTTVATNAVIEGNVAPTGFITTDGFRDMLEIARQVRPSLYDLRFEKPRPITPRHRCFGVPERLNAAGALLTPLDEAAVRDAARALRAEGVESIAVCFLHSYLNPVHERRAGEILREVFPEATVSLSCDVAPEFREFFRASTTVINAAIRPIVARYLRRIEEELRCAGVSAELLVMQSSGGVFSFQAAAEKPVFMVESGPAAGVMAATYVGAALGYDNVISFDMGGTTAKAGLVQHGRPRITKEYEVGAMARGGGGGAKARGYPIRTPVIDLVEIGAGGGSIAWVDSGGVLRVGPRSAGADPGPACYGNGGTEPTITDANLLLGRLNPDYFLGGEYTLDVELARNAIQTRCAAPLGLDVLTVANGIVEIANAAMTGALRLVSVQRGIDPRGFVLVAFGGAGPVHANRLAAEAEIGTLLIPMSPGTTSALGLLVTDLQHDYSVTHNARLHDLDTAAVSAIYRDLEAQALKTLANEGVATADTRLIRQVDLRYVGQSYELTVPLTTSSLDEAGRAAVAEDFHRAHHQAYGFGAPGEPVELVSIRLTAIGSIAKPRLRDNGNPHGYADPKTTRQVWFKEAGGFVETPVFDRYTLGEGAVIAGPAIVEELDSTSVIHPGYAARVDRFGNLLVSPTEERAQ